MIDVKLLVFEFICSRHFIDLAFKYSIYFETKLQTYKTELTKLELEEFTIQEWLTDAPSRNLNFKILKTGVEANFEFNKKISTNFISGSSKINILNNLNVLKTSNKKILIKGSFGFKAKVDKNHRLRNPALGGGAILDVGCYPLSMSKLIAGHLQGLPFAEPKGIEATGRIDETGVDLQSSAHLVFSDTIDATINCAIDEELPNTLVISNGEISITATDPWHCGQSQNGNSFITLANGSGLTKEIPFKDSLGLFAREIEHASKCILEKKIESNFITHSDTQSNMFWLDQWRQQMQIVCPKNLIKNSFMRWKLVFLKI